MNGVFVTVVEVEEAVKAGIGLGEAAIGDGGESRHDDVIQELYSNGIVRFAYAFGDGDIGCGGKVGVVGVVVGEETYFAPISTVEATKREGLTETREEPTLYPSI